jgi:CBS domain-containing protein
MLVRDIMTSRPATCGPDEAVGTALARMWEEDCGILPVVEEGRVTGVITDRDIAMALLFKGRRPEQLRVGEAVRDVVFSCGPDDDVATALATMGEHRVRRLPVLEEGRLCGVLSMNDIVLEARSTRGAQVRPTYGQVIKTLQLVCRHAEMPLAV